ncbi:hypothetical protein AQUCO_02200176v1 [Aquilegia coerulea]|uniref:Uncharacterized protein n=1 Tax=Aquilegia coerulea TaxID=218851 RepID=A0A2G5DDF2_AQUCA|nr:hypothetical protein AQUCO_02200176v1 [Aquilegia coerulea]
MQLHSIPVLPCIHETLKLLITAAGRMTISAAVVDDDVTAWILLALAAALTSIGCSPQSFFWLCSSLWVSVYSCCLSSKVLINGQGFS